MRRPVGVTIIAILAIIAGVVQLLGSLGFLGISVLALPGAELAAFAGALGIAAGVVLLIMAVLSIVFGVGALMLRSWAWTLGVVLFGISLVANVVLMLTGAFTVTALISAVVAAIILAYLFTNTVRAAFGHEPGYTRHGGRPVAH